MGQNSNSFKIYLKRKIKAFWMPLLMVFTFFVPALFASDQFPMQTHSQPLEGTLSSDEILIRMKTIKNITAHDALGNSIQIPQNTTVETSTSFLQMLDQYSLNKNQSQDDIFFNDILQQFQILKYFESIESTKSTAESSDSSEKKSTKQKVKIVESLNKGFVKNICGLDLGPQAYQAYDIT